MVWLGPSCIAGQICALCSDPKSVPFTSAIAQQMQTAVHGADSLFTSRTVKLAWLVRRGATEDATEVVIRAVDSGWNYRWVRLDGVDPFSKSRKVFVATRPLERQTNTMAASAAAHTDPMTTFAISHLSKLLLSVTDIANRGAYVLEVSSLVMGRSLVRENRLFAENREGVERIVVHAMETEIVLQTGTVTLTRFAYKLRQFPVERCNVFNGLADTDSP